MQPDSITAKACTKCGLIKPLTGFYRDKRRKDAHTSECKDCKQALNRRWKAKSHACMNRAARKRYAANREINAARARQRHLLNPEIARAASRRWRQANPIKAQEAQRRWRQANRPRHVEHVQNRRAQKAAHFIDDVRADVLYGRDGGKCGICRKSVPRIQASIDHIIPLSKDGEHNYRNTQLAHRACNNRRQAIGAAQTRMFG